MIHSGVKKLFNAGIIDVVREDHNNSGKAQIFYGLTTKGLKQYVIRYNPSSHGFWQKMFSTFDDPVNHGLDINIDAIVEEFRNKVIPISKDRVVESHVAEKFNDFKHRTRSRQEFYNNRMPILEFLGEHGKILEKEFSKKIPNSKVLNCYKEYGLSELWRSGFLVMKYKDHKNYVGLSQFGILWLINNYYEKLGEQGNRLGVITEEDGSCRFEFETIPNDIDKKSIMSQIGTTILNHKHLIPKVFSKIQPNDIEWVEKIASIVSRIYFGNEPNQFDGDEETLLLFYSQKAMEREYARAVKKEHVSAIHALKEWIKEAQCDFPIFNDMSDSSVTLLLLLAQMKNKAYEHMKIIRAVGNGKFQLIFHGEPKPMPSRMENDTHDNEQRRRSPDISNEEIRMAEDINRLFIDTIKNILDHNGILKLEKLEQKLEKSIINIFTQKYIPNTKQECNNLLKIFQSIVKIIKMRHILYKIFLERTDYSRTYDLQDTLDMYDDLSTQSNQHVKSIENIVSFQFYTYLKSYSPLDWNKIMKKDPDLNQWYQDWLRYIKQFNKIYETKYNDRLVNYNPV